MQQNQTLVWLRHVCVSLPIVSPATQCSTSLPAFARPGAVTAIQWLVDAYILVFAALFSMGSIADRFRRKQVLSSGWRGSACSR
jgi:hypothetical protein